MSNIVDMTNSGMLTKEQLQLGMKVKVSQLSNIYDTYIFLKDAEFCGINDVVGVIAFICTELSAESDKYAMMSRTISIYNDSLEYEEAYTYDE